MLFLNSRRLSFGIMAVTLLALATDVASADHSASALFAGDPTGPPFYVGTSSPPAGVSGIELVGGAPGYLNGLSGGASAGAAGDVGISPLAKGQPELIAISIHLADTAGPSRSLSSLNDPALADIVADLNASTGLSPIPLTAYAFNSAPPQFAAAQLMLSSGEAASSGQPFDIVLATSNLVEAGHVLILNFSGEFEALDGISAISDVGAPPA
jgi:hypothetical protein